MDRKDNQQQPVSALYAVSETSKMLQDLQGLQQEGASADEMRRRVSETIAALQQHIAELQDRELPENAYPLVQKKEDIQCRLSVLKQCQMIIAQKKKDARVSAQATGDLKLVGCYQS